MKKIILLLIVTIWNNCIYAQINQENNKMLSEEIYSYGKVNWGIKAGLNYSNLHGEEINYIFSSNQTQYRIGFQAGIFANTNLTKHFGLKHELWFTQKKIGVQLNDSKNEIYDSKFNSSYVDFMPFNLTVRFDGLHFFAGPYISTLINANIQRKDTNGSFFKDQEIFGTAENDETEKLYLQKFDFGAHFGLGYRFKKGMLIDVRYMHGFTDVFQFANSYTNENPKTNNIKVYNRSWMISLGHEF